MSGRPLKSLRTRVLILVGGAMFLLLATLLGIYSVVTERSFGQLQDNFTRDRIQRVARGIGQLANSKLRLLHDSAEWDETFDYINGANPDFLARNFAPAVDSTEQDAILVLNAQKKLIGTVQPGNTENPYQPIKDLDAAALARSHLIELRARAGLCVVGNRVLLLAACPVLPSARDKPTNGWLVYGTFFNQERISELVLLSGVESLEIHPETGAPAPADFRRTDISGNILGPFTAFYEPTSHWQPGTKIPKALLLAPSLIGKQRVALDVGVVFAVYQHALTTRQWIVLGSILCAVALVFMTLLAVELNVLSPLASLDRQMDDMASRNGGDGVLEITRDDEIGRLAESANTMLQNVRAGRRKAEEHLRLIDSILDSTAEGIIAYSAVRNPDGAVVDFRVMQCNRTAEKICLVENGGLDGKTMLTLFPQLRDSDVFHRCVQVSTDRQRQIFENVYDRENRSQAWMRIALAPWEDGVVITFEDITSRKDKEKELALSYAEMDRFNAAMIGREERIIEIKREVNTLRQRLGLEPAYEENES